MKQRKYLDVLQVYRGIAALVVVVHHTIPSILYFNKIENPILSEMSSFGKLGVDFFFVLSGFIIAYTNLDKPIQVSSYLLRRLTRIYIPYLPIGVFIMVLYWLMPGMSASDRSFNVFNSLTLFPIGNPALSVAWSLSYELFFYLLFVVCIWRRKYYHILIFLWCIIFFLSETSQIKVSSFLFNFYVLEFFIGYVLAYSLVLNQRNIYFSSVVCILIINYILLPLPISNITISIGFSFLIFLSISIRNFRLPDTNLFMIIGGSSYSIYLIHNPLQSFLVRKFTFLPSDYVVPVVLGIVIVLSVLLGYLYYFVFEKKLTILIYDKLEKVCQSYI